MVQLLRREMEVAVSEEDYPLAARLRDHPYMRLSVDMEASRWGAQGAAAASSAHVVHTSPASIVPLLSAGDSCHAACQAFIWHAMTLLPACCRMRGQLLRAQELYQELRIRVSRDESQAGTVDDDALRQRLQRDINL